MRIMLINPHYRANSIHGMGSQVPLGLLMIGGPLIDDGHDVWLVNAEDLRLSDPEIVERATSFNPHIVMIGHSGSSPAHAICLRTFTAIKRAMPRVTTVYGGVHPTYHAKETLVEAPSIDIVVRGEGETITQRLVEALSKGEPLNSVLGISFRHEGQIVETDTAPLIRDFEPYRVGWELIEDWDRHQCWGMGRAGVIQFSRGCPHQCSYCGQRSFWQKWRHRDPVRLAKEIAWLHRTHGINFFTFADENPTTSPKKWRAFLEAMIEQNVPVRLTAAVRAADICRDEDILHLYKKAGFCAFLLGIETTNPEVIQKIRKRSSEAVDAKALRLLRKHGMISIAGQVTGLEHDSWKTGFQAYRHLLSYDPDFLNVMYVTPFDWTPFWSENVGREVVENDSTKWDFRHQVLATRHLKPWQLFLMVKLIELIFHLRPKHLFRMFAHPDKELRSQIRWCTLNAGIVWMAEIQEFSLRTLTHCLNKSSIKKLRSAKTAGLPCLPDHHCGSGRKQWI